MYQVSPPQINEEYKADQLKYSLASSSSVSETLTAVCANLGGGIFPASLPCGPEHTSLVSIVSTVTCISVFYGRFVMLPTDSIGYEFYSITRTGI